MYSCVYGLYPTQHSTCHICTSTKFKELHSLKVDFPVNLFDTKITMLEWTYTKEKGKEGRMAERANYRKCNNLTIPEFVVMGA